MKQEKKKKHEPLFCLKKINNGMTLLPQCLPIHIPKIKSKKLKKSSLGYSVYFVRHTIYFNLKNIFFILLATRSTYIIYF